MAQWKHRDDFSDYAGGGANLELAARRSTLQQSPELRAAINSRDDRLVGAILAASRKAEEGQLNLATQAVQAAVPETAEQLTGAYLSRYAHMADDAWFAFLGTHGKKTTASIVREATQAAATSPRRLVVAGALGLTAGAGLAFGVSSLFSGRGAAYNSLEGLRHGGMAGDLRRENTDFGSGYQGLQRSLSQPQAGGLRVDSMLIPEEVQRFREKWYSSDADRARLEQLKAQSQTSYSQLSPSEITPIAGTNRARVDLSRYKYEWEDADTILLRQKGLRGVFSDPVAIRLAGIDAPEIAHPGDPTEWFRFHQEQPHGRQSLREAQALTGGGPISIEIAADPKAKTYGRYLGVAYSQGQAKSLNRMMVEQGTAAALPFGDSGSDIISRRSIASAEKQAVRGQRGMWAEPYFQKYLSATDAMGGRLTFNTLTDLSRLGKNYHLAALESLLTSDEPGTDDPRVAGYIGRKLIPSYGRFFSGRGKAYNTNEGLRHGGMAGELRKENTEFGSGWRGLFGGLSSKVEKFLASGAKAGEKLLSPIAAASAARSTATLEEFITATGYTGKKYIARTAEESAKFGSWLQKQGLGAGGSEGAAFYLPGHGVFMDVPKLQEAWKARAVQKGMSVERATQAVGSEEFLKSIFYHESLEKSVAEGFSGLKTMKTGHAGAQVLIGEGGFIAQMEKGPTRELFEKVRQASTSDAPAFALGQELFSGGAIKGKVASKLSEIASQFDIPALARTVPALQTSQKQVWQAGVSGGKGHEGRAASRQPPPIPKSAVKHHL